MNTNEPQPRPWGWWKDIDEFESLSKDYLRNKGKTYYPVKVKHLCVIQGECLSLQYHEHRRESWYVVQGAGELILDTFTEGEYPTAQYNKVISKGDFIQIEAKQLHRIRGLSDEDLHIIEIQEGVGNTPMTCEQDIIRLEDNYGRANSKLQDIIIISDEEYDSEAAELHNV